MTTPPKENAPGEAVDFAGDARYRAVFEQAAIGIARVATDGRWLEVNDRLCEIIGYPRAELMSASFQDITHPDDLEADLADMRRVLRGEIQNYSMEKRYFHRNGNVIWIRLTVALVRNAAGEPDYFVSIVEDISALHAAEEKLANTMLQMEEMSMRHLLAMEAERKRLSRNLHDDMGQVLTSLNLILEGVRQKTIDRLHGEMLLRAKSCVNELMGLVRTVAYQLRPPQLDELGLMASLRWHLDRVGRDQGCEITLDENIGDMRFVAELELAAFRLTQEAVSNVLRHAGALHLTVHVGMEERRLVISVEDDGRGFDLSQVLLGTGTATPLGLLGMKEWASAVHGTILVNSVPGHGTAVVATFPVHD